MADYNGPGEDRFATPLPKNDSPISEPDDIPDDDKHALDDTHPITDTNVHIEEEYDEGLSGAAEAAEPNQNDAVEAYDPDKDQRRNKAT